jgi:Hypothetical protein TTHB210
MMKLEGAMRLYVLKPQNTESEIVNTVTRQVGGISKGAGVLLAAALFFAAGGFAEAATYKGAPMHVGKGTARIVVHTDKSGKPSSIAVMMTPSAMKGLPTELNKKNTEGSWEYPLSMPKDGPKTGYTHVVIDWNPHGHPPPHIYTVPHFDFHFYAISSAAVEKISFKGPTDPAVKVSNAALVAPDYKVIPDTAVNKMGVHAIDTTAPEFHGKPFTATFIYGYDNGQMIFVEPMVTLAYLATKPDLTLPVKAPAQYSHPGYYPTSYSVRYDKRSKAFVVGLDGLKHWSGK